MTKQIVNGNTIPSIVREAFRVSEEEKPGPVLLELPEDIAAEKVELTDLIPPHERFYAVAGEQIILKTAESHKKFKKTPNSAWCRSKQERGSDAQFRTL